MEIRVSHEQTHFNQCRDGCDQPRLNGIKYEPRHHICRLSKAVVRFGAMQLQRALFFSP
jgi:hypothetical protein